MKKIIINELLDRYERSKLFRDGSSRGRILIRIQEHEAFSGYQEHADEKREFLRAVRELQEAGLIGYEWVRFERGNLLERIWLETNEVSVRRAYQLAGRVSKAEQLSVLEQQIKEVLPEIELSGTVPRLRRVERQAVGLNLARLNGEYNLHSSTEQAVPSEQTPVDTSDCPAAESDICHFLRAQLAQMQEKRRISRFFFQMKKPTPSEWRETRKRNEDLLRFLGFLIDQNESEALERIISVRLFGDSKYFERELRAKVLSILREVDRSGEQSDEALLAARGIVKWPEILEFCGDIRIILEDRTGNDAKTAAGKLVDYSAQKYGAYLNAETLRHIAGIDLSQINRIMLIENKANYTWYLQKRLREHPISLIQMDGQSEAKEMKDAGRPVEECSRLTNFGQMEERSRMERSGCMENIRQELVLYHGGFFSPVRGRWFRKIAENIPKQTEVYHWGDIDLGGFRMHVRLKREIFLMIQPYQMDVETLKQFGSFCRPLEGEAYRSALRELCDNPEYAVFHPVIRYMLDKNVRLEQEAETCVFET